MHPLRHVIVCLVMVAGYLPCLAAGSLRLSNLDSLKPRFTLSLPDATDTGSAPPESELSLHMLLDGDTAELAIAAAYVRQGADVTMELLTELDYETGYILRYNDGTRIRHLQYRTPARPKGIPAFLTARYPQCDTLPANLLFLQFRFSKPMFQDAQAWTRIRIRADSPGAPDIPFAWRQRCFWLDSGRVLQLMVHPGRVKSGIEYGGMLLHPGRRYVLRIDSGLQDQQGRLLPAQEPQRFTVGPPDHRIPRLERVQAEVRAGGAEPVELQFSDVMDYSGVLTGLALFGPDGREASVVVDLSKDGRRVSLKPREQWFAGKYHLELNAEIRDLGANTLRRPFEVHTIRETRKDNIPFRYSIRAR